MEEGRNSDTSTGPLDIEYARSVIEQAGQLERVQKLLPLLPQDFLDVMQAQSDDFLYGAATLVQAAHDLIGNQALDDASALLEQETENMSAIRMAKALIGTFGLLEAMGLVGCKEIVRRHESS